MLSKYKWGMQTAKKLSKGSSNLGTTLDKPMIIVTKSKKLLQLGNTRVLRLYSSGINLILLYV